jgi:hypothetical protein
VRGEYKEAGKCMSSGTGIDRPDCTSKLNTNYINYNKNNIFCALGALSKKKIRKDSFGFVIYIFPQKTTYEVRAHVGLNSTY